MRRYITKEDKRILDKYSGRIQTLMVSGQTTLNFVALAISCTVGAIGGAIVGLGVLGMNHPYSLPAFFLIMLGITVLGTVLTAVIGTRRKRNRIFRVGKTMINGATCVGDITCPPIAYTEDDLVDGNGHPYKILCSEFLAMANRIGERLIVVVNGEMVFLMKAEGKLATLIPAEAPQAVSEESAVIAHQNELDHISSMPGTAVSAAASEQVPVMEPVTSPAPSASAVRAQNMGHPAVTEHERRQIDTFFNYYVNTHRLRRSLVLLGTGFFGFCLLAIVIFAVYGFFFDGTAYEDNYFPIALPLLLVLPPIFLYTCLRLFRSYLRKKYRNIVSVRPVILISSNVSFAAPYARDFIISELNVDGKMEAKQYVGHRGYDCADASRMKPGQTIYKYTYGDGELFFGTR